ncbi:hypothetical protein CHS0354_021144 [Potamilus streckersoni]|uniref:MD-2-related lipid-recognition domain-containing protein n=1 Tax=Potamilus streckersoni TaxID=2493646 RepID=A0AAE0T2E0_9BIVA|nr:hypothetical protein CHS0354_021144 [Potamilus streckersoni]
MQFMTLKIALLVLVIGMSESQGKRELHSLQWSVCNTNPSSPISVTKIAVSPMPVEIPGTFNLTIDGALSRQISHTSLSLHIKRKTFLLDIPIPCISNVGSCTYDDLCTVISQMISEDWGGIMGNIGTQINTMLRNAGVPDHCPLDATALHVNQFTFSLPEVPSLFSTFATGDYHARLSATEKATGQEVLCIDLDLSVKKHEKPCSGLSCIFG